VSTLAARAAGVIRSPRATLTAVAAEPRWAAILVATTVITFACQAAFLSTGVGQLALVDQWERTAIAFGGAVDDAQYARLHELSRQGVGYAAVMALASGPLLTGALALILLGATRALGAAASLAQLLAIVSHAGVILALRQVIATPVNYALESLASPTTLVRFAGALDEGSPAARFLGAIDLFVVWWVVVLAVGVGALVHRPARRLALAFAGAYVALALLLAAAMALTGGTA
jgi:hypothetical protein